MPLAPNGPTEERVLDQDAFDRRHVADGRDEIVVQVLALAGKELLHQRESEALRRAALDLAFDQRRIDRPADVVRADEAEHFHAPELNVDLDLRHMRAGAEHRIRFALAVLVERRRRRIERLDDLDHEASGVDRQGGEFDPPIAAGVRDGDRADLETQLRVLADIGEAQDLRAAWPARRGGRRFRRRRSGARRRSCRSRASHRCPPMRDRSVRSARRARRRKSARSPCSSPGRYPPRPGTERIDRRA